MPKRIEDPALRRIEMMGFYGTVSLKEAIEAEAKRLNIKKAEFIRQAVAEKLKRAAR